MATDTRIALRDALVIAADAVVAKKDFLTKADQAIGDGDHGIGMARGFAAFAEAVRSADGAGAGPAMAEGGKALMMKAGGASGAIFGTFFREAGKALPDAPAPTAADMAGAFGKGLEAVQARGKARPGDKTMVDALHPAVAALDAASGESLGAAIRAAADAAEAGADATCGMMATTGKAKSLGDRAVGHPDPGALTFSIFLRALEEALG